MILIFLSLFNLIIFFKISKLSKFFNIYDKPDNKLKLHKKEIPIIGGIILALNFSVLFFYQIFFLNEFLSIDLNKLNFLEIITGLLFILSYFTLGLYDDKINLSPNKKIFFSILIILLAISFNENLVVKKMSISFIENKIFLDNYAYFFTIFCILILVNSLNFYDGINGQSCLIFLISFSYLFIKSDMHYFYIISIILILFILFLNISNKIFLGDGGIYLLSIILSSSLIYEHNIQKNIIFADEIFFLLLLPGLDLLRLTLKRLLSLKNPFFGDRDHIHHLLINKYSLKVSNSILFLISITPIILFSVFTINFFLVFFIFLVIYVFLIKILKSND